MHPMRLFATASLLGALASVALVPVASAGTCDNINFSVLIDQTGGLACDTADWALIGGPSPIGLTVAYARCYVFDEPIGSWVPDCT